MKEMPTRLEGHLQLTLLETLYRRKRLTEEDYRRCKAQWEAMLIDGNAVSEVAVDAE